MKMSKKSYILSLVVFALFWLTALGPLPVGYYYLRNKVLAHHTRFIKPDDDVKVNWFRWWPRAMELGIYLANPGGAVHLPPNYTENQGSTLFHFAKANVNIVCDGGTCVLTDTAGWKLDAGNNHVYIGSDTPYGMNLNASNGGGLSFAGYTGSGVAFQIGDATASTFFVTLKNVHVDISAAAAGAIGIKFFRTQFFYTDNYSCSPVADSQICSTSDGTGDFTGIGEMHNSFITAGAGGTNAIGIQSGPLTTHFKISGGNISLLNAGTSKCLDANGGEMELDFPNANTCLTAVTVEKNGTSIGRVTGWLRVDSGITNGANFGANTLDSHIFCANCLVSTPVTDSGGAASFNSFFTPDSLWINGTHWSIFAGNGHYTVKDQVNSKSPIDIVPNGNMFLGNGATQITLDNGSRLFIPEASAGAGVANQCSFWDSSSSHAFQFNCNNTGTKNFADLESAQAFTGTKTFNNGIVAGGTAAALTGTGACATLSTQTGGAWAGRATCTGTTGASTLTITPGTTAPNGWVCSVYDQTTRANLLQQTATVAASCTLTATSVTQNDVFVFTATAF